MPFEAAFTEQWLHPVDNSNILPFHNNHSLQMDVGKEAFPG